MQRWIHLGALNKLARGHSDQEVMAGLIRLEILLHTRLHVLYLQLLYPQRLRHITNHVTSYIISCRFMTYVARKLENYCLHAGAYALKRGAQINGRCRCFIDSNWGTPCIVRLYRGHSWRVIDPTPSAKCGDIDEIRWPPILRFNTSERHLIEVKLTLATVLDHSVAMSLASQKVNIYMCNLCVLMPLKLTVFRLYVGKINKSV